MKIEILKGDITKIEIDVIVNAANSSLLGGGGVDGAIHRAGGAEILEDCMKVRGKQGGCKVGEAVITRAGNLPSKRVIHTVGPFYNQGGNKKVEQLKNCYINSIKLMLSEDFSSIAFPNISTGIYKFPKELAAESAIQAVQEFKENEKLERLVFVCFDDENFRLYQELLK